MKRISIDTTQQEGLRVALVDGQCLYDLDIENPGHEQKRANIYKNKIIRIEPSLEAVLIDYSAERHGFLSPKEIARGYFPTNYSAYGRPNIRDVLREGQEVIVQIDKEERGNEGTTLIALISLAGSYLVLMPNNPCAGGISRRIEGDDHTELKKTLTSLELPDGMDLIARTAGVGKFVETLQWDLSSRLKHWETTQKVAENRLALFLIHQGNNVIIRTFRDYLHQDIGEVLIDNPKVFELARQYIATLGRLGLNSKVKLCTGETPLFNHYQIESQIGSAFQREVRLFSGGSIVIDSTEALTAIDINSARTTHGGDIGETAFNTDLEAADEIARQLRLRNLGGLIVIGLIDMAPARHQRVVGNRLCGAACQDRARIQINHISRFGLLETSRQHLSPSLGESSHRVCPRCSGTGTVHDNGSLSLPILHLIEEEASKGNTKEAHAIVPVPIAPYLLSEKRATVSAIESYQGDVRAIIMPSDEIRTPHYPVLCVCKGEETLTLSYLLSKLHEEKMALPSDEELAEHKRPEQPALVAFVMPDAPPASMLEESVAAPAVAAAPVAVATPAQPGPPSCFLSTLRNVFSDTEEARPVEVPVEEKTEEKPERQQERRKPWSNNRRNRNSRNDRRDNHDSHSNRDNRDNHNTRADNTEGYEPRESREKNRRNCREKQPQDVEAHDARQTAGDDADRARPRDEQQPRHERPHRCNDDKHQTQQEAKVQIREEPEVQEIEQEERVQTLPCRKPRQLFQKVCIESAVTGQTAEVTSEAVVAEAATPCSELVKAELPAAVENVVERDENGESREASGMPRRPRRSLRHLRVSSQCRCRYRDERYPTQPPMPLIVACASPEMAFGKVWIRYPVARPQDQQPEGVPVQDTSAIEAAKVVTTPIVMAETVIAASVTVEPVTMKPATAEPVVVEPVVAVESAIAGTPEIVEPATVEPVPVEAPAVEAPQAIVPVTIDVEPVAAEPEIVETAPVVEAPVETIVPTKEAVVEASMIETAPTAPAEPVKAETPVSRPVVAAGSCRATAPMTRASTPDYVPEAPRHSTWMRPPFAFEGKGAAGGHSVTRKATVKPTRPQPVE